MKRILKYIIPLVSLCGQVYAAEESTVAFPEALKSASIEMKSIENGQENSLLLGNGDLYGIVWQQDGQWFMRITKNDIWDTRVDTSKDPALPFVDFKKGVMHGFSGDMPSWKKPYPQPRCASGISLSPKLAATTAKLDLSRAVATLSSGNEKAEIRILKDRNVVLLSSSFAVDLKEIKAASLPDAKLGTTDGVQWLEMKMPNDIDQTGIKYAIAVATKGKTKAIALVTSDDINSLEVRAAAMKLAKQTVAEEYSKLVKTHEAGWSKVWQKSGIELGDKQMQNWWYRTLYFAQTVCKPGTAPVGLMPPLATDKTPWHADFHFNYNAWQANWSLAGSNHGELMDPWITFVKSKIPRFQYLAKVTYGCEGIHFPISTFLKEPDPEKCKSVNKRQLSFNPWGLTIGLGGMTVHSIWQKHLYDPNPVYLKEKIYPIMREVALFYVSFMRKCKKSEDGKILLGPSYSPEHGATGAFNCPFDIAYVHYAFDAFIQASTELEVDKELAKKCADMKLLLPDYPVAKDNEGKDVVVDWKGCKFREIGVHNITVPTVPVFPADQVTWFSSAEQKKLFLDTINITRFNGNNSHVMFNIAKARLGSIKGYEDSRKWFASRELPNGLFLWQGHHHNTFLTEMIGISGLVNEFLIQSVDNKLRLFPCWPAEHDAAFKDLRSQGGFLVTSSFKNGKVLDTTITSLYGRTLQIVSPWKEFYVNGKKHEADARGLISVTTKKGQVLKLSSQP